MNSRLAKAVPSTDGIELGLLIIVICLLYTESCFWYTGRGAASMARFSKDSDNSKVLLLLSVFADVRGVMDGNPNCPLGAWLLMMSYIGRVCVL